MNYQERDQQIVDLLNQQRPLRAIFKIMGLSHEWGHELCKKLIKKHDIQYTPTESGEPALLDEDTRKLRAKLADTLFKLKGTPTSIAIQTGIPPRAQKSAISKPFDYDWKLSEISRLAAAAGISVKDLFNAA